MTQEELGSAIGYSADMVRKIEADLRRPAAAMGGPLADELGLSPYERAALLAVLQRTRAFQAAGILADAESTVVPPLVAPPTTLVGRAVLLDALCTLLAQETVQLVTLSGAGGIGKTRLALEAARRVRPSFPDGVVIVSLAALDDAGLVAPAIADALGLIDAPVEALPGYLAATLAQRNMLLVLDNFEHLLAATPLITTLLGAAPLLRVLITSRISLRLAGEHLIIVPPLAVPRLDQPAEPPAALATVDAVRLFIDRMRAVAPNSEITAETAADIAAICSTLDGIPLAIELAAARSRLLSVAELRARLENGLHTLAHGARDLSPRHQTLHKSIDWSYTLLSPDDRARFARLAVFVGGWTLEAYEALEQAIGAGDDALAGLETLIDNHLVVVDNASGAQRYRLFNPLRCYALERLAADAHTDALVAHAEYFAAFAETAERSLAGPQQMNWLERLEREAQNIDVALAFVMQQKDAATAIRLVAALWRYWYRRGNIGAARRRIEAVLRLEHTCLRPELQRRRAEALLGAALLATTQRAYTDAERLLVECRFLGHKLADCLLIAHARYVQAMCAYGQGELDIARHLLLDSLARYQHYDPHAACVEVLEGLGWVALCSGDSDSALAWFEESRARADEAGDVAMTARASLGIACAMLATGQYARARPRLTLAIDCFRAAGDRRHLAHTLEALATVVSAEGDATGAVRMFGAAAELRGETATLLPRMAQLETTRVLDQLREKLGADMFAQEWAQGQLLELSGQLGLRSL